jgi:nucleotide-binding universal stress UspA family protein
MMGPEASRRATMEAPMYQTVLVPLDGSHLAMAALGPAAQLARALGADVVLMTAARPARVPGVESDLAVQLGETDALALLTEAASGGELKGLPVTRLVAKGELAEAPAEAILTAVRDVDAGLVVMATHGRSGVRRAVLGSVADAVVARSPVPVLLIPPHWRPPDGGHPAALPSRLIVALDGSPEAEAALMPAAALSGGLGAQVDLARVVADAEPPLVPDERQDAADDGEHVAAYLEAAALRLRGAGVRARRIRGAVLHAHGRTVAETLLAYADESHAGMLVLATHARRGLDRLLHGSVEADALVRATLPILVVRAELPAPPAT